ncbi:MAG: hypothetical protein V4507_09430, partial [Verrucomicrobiota bacterium]
MKTSSDSNRLAITFQQERKRAVAQGILETAGSTFLLMIAVQWYHAGFVAKSLLASSASCGMILSIFIVIWVAHHQWRLSQAAAGFSFAGGIAFLLASLFPSLFTLVVGGVFALICSSCVIPLMTQLYQNHYPSKERGRLFARTTRYRIVAAILFSDLAGRYLTGRLQSHPTVLACYALALFAMTVFLRKIPSDPLHKQDSPHLLQAFRHLKHDHFFRWTLHCWMILGFANLMMVALRVDYLANPRYGISLNPTTIALL